MKPTSGLSAKTPGDLLKAQGALGAPTLPNLEPLGTPSIDRAKAAVKDMQDTLMPKKAELHPETALFSHQRNVGRKFVDSPTGGLVVAHGVGTGKTVTSLHMKELARKVGKAKRSLVVVPSALRNNYLEQGIQNYTTSKGAIYGNKQEVASGTHADIDAPQDADYHVVSMELFREDPEKWIRNTKADTLIVDEFHKARDERGVTYKALKQVRPLVKNFIGLTGSVVSNDPSDIVPLVDIATNGRHQLGTRRDFVNRFTTIVKGKRRIKDANVLRNVLAPHVDYFGTEQMRGSDMPKKMSQDVLVEMSPDQHQLFRFAVGKLKPDVIGKLQKDITSLSDREISHIFSRIIHARKVSNSLHTLDDRLTPEQSAEQTPKVKRLLDDVEQHLKETPDGQVFIHTNLVHGGVDVLQAGLKARGIDHGIFMGKKPGHKEEDRQRDVQDYLAGKKRVLVGTVNEGLSLGNTTLVASLDGHFNPEQINQAEARGVRAGGLAHRAPQDRQVVVKRYITIPPRGHNTGSSGMWNWFSNLFSWGKEEPKKDVLDVPSVDQWIYDIAQRKHHLNTELREALKKVGSAPMIDPPKSLREEYWDRFGRRFNDPKTPDRKKLIEEEKQFLLGVRNSAKAKMLSPYLRELLEKALAVKGGDPKLLMLLSLIFHKSQELGALTPGEAAKMVNMTDKQLSNLIRGELPNLKPTKPLELGKGSHRKVDEEAFE